MRLSRCNHYMPATQILLLLGDQLFPTVTNDFPPENTVIWMAEDQGLCTHFQYHKHKLILFLSAMRSYADDLRAAGYTVEYHALTAEEDDASYLEKLTAYLDNHAEVDTLLGYTIEDKFFADKIAALVKGKQLTYTPLPSAGFVTSRARFAAYDKQTKRPHMARFYEQQRQRLNILVDDEGQPLHGKWSFDADNRKKLPKKYAVPDQPDYAWTEHTRAVVKVVDALFPEHPGATDNFWLATTRRQALYQLDDFLKQRFADFGPYEDAFEPDAPFLLHSVLSPYLNMGLITAGEVVERALSYAEEQEVHYPSVEGFVRQIIGWREFIRGMYHQHQDTMLSTDFFDHQRKLTEHWWIGNTGLIPVDNCIKRANKYGYLHHIERLMVMGNVMLLSEIHPDEVYRWFMSFFVDSADWVMVPNVYGMSQFADGGLFATKPYICGANYWSKMSSYSKNADWADTIDGLYWRFIDRKRDFMRKNPRLSMMVSLYDKMNEEKKQRLNAAAQGWLDKYTC